MCEAGGAPAALCVTEGCTGRRVQCATYCIPTWMSSRLSKASKISMLGWWMVTMTVRPLRATLRTARITMEAARASRPGGRAERKDTRPSCYVCIALTCSDRAPQWTRRGRHHDLLHGKAPSNNFPWQLYTMKGVYLQLQVCTAHIPG